MQFITHSKWSVREVLDHVARDADELIGYATAAALIIDESGFAKQEKMSVGASRQYLGRLGKVDNGQVAVFPTHAALRRMGMNNECNYRSRRCRPDSKLSLLEQRRRTRSPEGKKPRGSNAWFQALLQRSACSERR
jgi:SRSO17 transposase